MSTTWYLRFLARRLESGRTSNGFPRRLILGCLREGRDLGRFLRFIAQKSFNDGLARCNQLGMRLIVKEKVDRFLDVGCGNGELTMEFASVINPREIYGIEFVDEVRPEAERKGIKCFKYDLNGRWGFDDNYFDVILSSQSIEHMHNTRLYLEECHRCLKPGGQVIILTENLASWDNIISLVFGWQPFSTTNINGWHLGNPYIWHKHESKDEDFLTRWQDTGVSGITGHVRVLTFIGLRELLRKTGFTKVDVYSKGYLPLWGRLSDSFCWIDKRHGRFLVAQGFK